MELQIIFGNDRSSGSTRHLSIDVNLLFPVWKVTLMQSHSITFDVLLWSELVKELLHDELYYDIVLVKTSFMWNTFLWLCLWCRYAKSTRQTHSHITFRHLLLPGSISNVHLKVVMTYSYHGFMDLGRSSVLAHVAVCWCP